MTVRERATEREGKIERVRDRDKERDREGERQRVRGRCVQERERKIEKEAKEKLWKRYETANEFTFIKYLQEIFSLT